MLLMFHLCVIECSFLKFDLRVKATAKNQITQNNKYMRRPQKSIFKFLLRGQIS